MSLVALVTCAVPSARKVMLAMPAEDGFALIREVRTLFPQDEKRIPALALTAYAGEHAAEQVVEAGFDTYLTKPIEAARLVRAVAALVRDPSQPGDP